MLLSRTRSNVSISARYKQCQENLFYDLEIQNLKFWNSEILKLICFEIEENKKEENKEENEEGENEEEENNNSSKDNKGL